MQWLNLNTEFLRSELWLDASPLEHSVWIRLAGYCATQENRGRIRGMAEWSPEKCLRTVQCTLEEVKKASALWSWRGEDLVVEGYPKTQEAAVQQKRTLNSKAAQERWRRAREAAAAEPETPPPDASACASAVGPQNASADAEGNGREGKERSNGATKGARDPKFVALVHRIVSAYPVRAGQVAAEHAVVEDLDAQSDPEAMLAGTLAIAAVINAHPSGGRHPFAMGADRFFREKRWRDDPQVWRGWIEGKGPAPAGISAAFAAERTKIRSPKINGLTTEGTTP